MSSVAGRLGKLHQASTRGSATPGTRSTSRHSTVSAAARPGTGVSVAGESGDYVIAVLRGKSTCGALWSCSERFSRPDLTCRRSRGRTGCNQH